MSADILDYVIGGIFAHQPQSWDSLSKAARNMAARSHVQMARMAHSGFSGIIAINKGQPTGMTTDALLTQAHQYEFYRQCYKLADAISLGAQAIGAEGKPGDFSDQDKLSDSIEVTTGVGALMAQFIEGATLLTETLATDPIDSESRKNDWDRAAAAILSQTKATVTAGRNMASASYMSLKPETVTGIVEERIGILGDEVRQQIAATMLRVGLGRGPIGH